MESEKRKSDESDVVSGRMPKKARAHGSLATPANDDEVEEFYAILRRIHVAVNYFQKGDCSGRRLPRKGSEWMHCLEGKILGEVNGGASGMSKRMEDVEEKWALDLNANPGSEESPILEFL